MGGPGHRQDRLEVDTQKPSLSPVHIKFVHGSFQVLVLEVTVGPDPRARCPVLAAEEEEWEEAARGGHQGHRSRHPVGPVEGW